MSDVTPPAHHILQQTNRPPFQRAILQSGNAHMPGAVGTRRQLLEAGKMFSDNVGCPFNPDNLAPTLKCLMSKDAEELADNEPIFGLGYSLFFKPVTDGKYIKKHPELTLREGLTLVPAPDVLLGFNQDEASLFLFVLEPYIFAINGKFQVDRRDIMGVLQSMYSIGNDSVLLEMLENMYDNKDKDVHKRYLNMAIRAGTDSAFFCPSMQFEDALLSASSQVYSYRFRYRPAGPEIAPKWLGVFHGLDVPFVYGEPFDPTRNHTDSSKLMSRKMMRYWANFARTGDPNVSPPNADKFQKGETTHWQPLKPETGNYFNLDLKSSSMGRENRKRCRYWNEIFPEIYKFEGHKLRTDYPSLISIDPTRFYT